MDRDEIIRKLSSMHLDHTTDPAELCSASFHDFDENHPDFAERGALQAELFRLGRENNESWAR